MPSIKDFKQRLKGKYKKKLAETQVPVPGPSQDSPKLSKTAPVQTGDKGGLGLSTSFTSSRSPTPSSRIKIDEHKQILDTSRPSEQTNSSDPDTSLYDYEDNKVLTSSLRRSISLPYGTDEIETRDEDIESLVEPLEVEAPLEGTDDTAVSSVLPPSFEGVLDQDFDQNTLNSLRIPVIENITPTQSSKYNTRSSTPPQRSPILKSAATSPKPADYDVESLRQQVKDLDNLVYKLNQQLSVCQAQHQEVRDPNGGKFLPLSKDAPTPAWMVNFKYLSPLIKALEDQVAIKDQELRSLRRKFAKYDQDIRSLIYENDQLKASVKAGDANPDAITKKAWSQLQQQALLVLEENEILLKELDIYEDNIDELHEKNHQDASHYEDKLRKVESERYALSEQLADTKYELQITKSRYDELKSSSRLKINQEEHDRITIELKAKMEHLQENREQERKAFEQRITQGEISRKELESQLNGANSDLAAATHEIKQKDKEIKTLETEVTRLEKDIDNANDVVSKLLMLTDAAVIEKESLRKYIRAEKKDKKKSIEAIMGSEIVKDELLESFKKYRVKAEAKMDKLSIKLEKQAGEFAKERREYERQIKHLRLVAQEKDCLLQEAKRDQKEVEDTLEFVWKATENENDALNCSLRRLKASQVGDPSRTGS